MSRSALERKSFRHFNNVKLGSNFGANGEDLTPSGILQRLTSTALGIQTHNSSDAGDPQSSLLQPVPFQHNLDEKFNLSELLSGNIRTHDYLLQKLLPCESAEDVVHNFLESDVSHVEPWTKGSTRIPSSAFQILYRLFLFRITYGQLNQMLFEYSQNNVFMRAIAILYLRYTLPPKLLWNSVEPFVTDPTPLPLSSLPDHHGNATVLGSNSFHDDTRHTIPFGRWLRDLLIEHRYFDTTLPRIPTPILRSYQIKFLQYKPLLERALLNRALLQTLGFSISLASADDSSNIQLRDDEKARELNKWESMRLEILGGIEQSFGIKLTTNK
eukprot:g1727.t1